MPPRKRKPFQCLLCGEVQPSTNKECRICGNPLVKKRWKLTTKMIRYIRALAHSQKGLTEDEYRLRVQAVGCESTKELKQAQYIQLVNGLKRLPDVRKSQ